MLEFIAAWAGVVFLIVSALATIVFTIFVVRIFKDYNDMNKDDK